MKRPRKKKPHYSAKPGQSETTQAKEYEPKIVYDSGPIKNIFGWAERTTITETALGEHLVQIEMEGGIFLKPTHDETNF